MTLSFPSPSPLRRASRARRPGLARAARAWLASVALLAPLLPTPARADAPREVRELSIDIYRELVAIDTTESSGDTLRAARAMAARLVAGGLPAGDVKVFEVAPKRGNLVARLRGTGKQKPILLLAHSDVVEAKRADWTTDPFELVEKDGYMYGRGTADDKYMAATFVLNLIRYKREGYRPDRDIIFALTTDEEIVDRHGLGINWLLKNQRPLIEAELALNEGGGVGVKGGKPIWNSVQTTEKRYQTFHVEVKNSGGHSSQPRRDNAIYELSRALLRLADFQFPLQLNATTRLYFERMASLEPGQLGQDFKALLAPAPDPAAEARLSAMPPYNAQLRTTCVATELQAGHAENALPQLARATVNCRILPGVAVEDVQHTLERVLGSGISVSFDRKDVASAPSPLRPDLVSAIEQLTAQFWPGITVLPTMSAGGTDSRFLRNAGIPAYGHSGLASDIFDNRIHGKDERVNIDAYRRGQEYLYQLVKTLAGGTTP